MIPKTQPPCCLHFGCLGGKGHFVHAPWQVPAGVSVQTVVSQFRPFMEGMDGRLHDEAIDRWLTHWFEAADGSQMTFIAKRDRTVDTRQGSWCGFLMPGNLPLKTALRVAMESFPNVKVWVAETCRLCGVAPNADGTCKCRGNNLPAAQTTPEVRP